MFCLRYVLRDVVSELDAVTQAGYDFFFFSLFSQSATANYNILFFFSQALLAGQTPDQVAEELAKLAIRLGSSDNVTIVVVQFFHIAEEL